MPTVRPYHCLSGEAPGSRRGTPILRRVPSRTESDGRRLVPVTQLDFHEPLLRRIDRSGVVKTQFDAAGGHRAVHRERRIAIARSPQQALSSRSTLHRAQARAVKDLRTILEVFVDEASFTGRLPQPGQRGARNRSQCRAENGNFHRARFDRFDPGVQALATTKIDLPGRTDSGNQPCPGAKVDLPDLRQRNPCPAACRSRGGRVEGESCGCRARDSSIPNLPLGQQCLLIGKSGRSARHRQERNQALTDKRDAPFAPFNFAEDQGHTVESD